MNSIGARIAEYLRGVRAVTDAIWLCVFVAIAATLVNAVVPATSQGAELLYALDDSPNRVLSTLLLIATAAYCTAACWVAATVTLRFARTANDLAPNARAARRLVPHVTAIAVAASLLTLVAPPPLVALAVPTLVVCLVLALPLIARRGIALRVPSYDAMGFGTIVVAALALAIAGALAGIAITLAPVDASRAIGAWAIVYVAVGFWALVAQTLFVALPKRFGLPALMVAPILLFVIFSRANDNHAIRAVQNFSNRADSPATIELAERFARWRRSACADTLPGHACPVVLVAAEGGGARAAFWTAALLGDLDEQTHGRFARHLFAISAVSGGALGSAAYVAARADGRHGADARARLRRFLASDYLAPALGSLLFPDSLQRFVPVAIRSFDRATAFDLALERSWRDAFGTDRFAGEFNALYSGASGSALPSLLLNATNVESGRRFIVSNLGFTGADRGDALYAFDTSAPYHIVSLPLSSAVGLSARFPYVSPHAVVMAPRVSADASSSARELVPWGRLVDGGYFENSGAASIADVLEGLVRESAREPALPLEFLVVVISSDPDARVVTPDLNPMAAPPALARIYRRLAQSQSGFAGELGDRSLALSEVTTPIEALFDARGAHEEAELRRLHEIVDGMQTTAALDCAARKISAASCRPMRAFETLAYAHVVADGKHIDSMMRGMNHGHFDSVALSQLVKPGLGWSLSQRSRDAIERLARETAAGATQTQAVLLEDTRPE